MTGPDPQGQPPLESEIGRSEQEPALNGEDQVWVDLARAAFTSSDDWFNASIRNDVEKAYSNFRGQHPSGSKYHTTYYQKRSRLFRPKTRSMVMGREAAAAVAFFSTADAVNCQAFNSGNRDQVLAAEIHKNILNHRLADTEQMFWFLTLIGAIQDASTAGVVISRQGWDYQERVVKLPNGSEVRVVERDTPYVELIPIENLRISPAAKWYDPINTSPFVIELMPMYVHEILDTMERRRPNGDPIYRRLERAALQTGIKQDWDTIRRKRAGERRIDVHEAETEIGDYDTVWVHRNIIRKDGVDYVYETLGTELMLSHEVLPLYEIEATRNRPYVMGYSIIETHKPYPSSPCMIVESLQENANDIVNLRLDNVRLALGKRWFVRRGRGVDTTSLTRNVPSSVTMVADPTDVKEAAVQDVTRSSYEEQDRINMDFDELAGRFSQASVGTNRKLGETLGGMNMLRQDANEITEYQIRVVAETWLEPVVRQLVQLESQYENDLELLNMVGEPLGLGAEEVMKLMRNRVRTSVAVGFNATDPEKRIQRLALGLNTMSTLAPQLVQQGDMREIAKEVFGALGYKDATRFLPALKADAEQDPRIADLQRQVQELTQMVETKSLEIQGRKEVAQINADVKLAIAEMTSRLEAARIELERLDRLIETEASDVKRRELYLQREALSHNILDADRNFQLKLAEFKQRDREIDGENGEGKEKGGAPEGPGPMDLKGTDMAGTIARDDFGMVPGQGG